MIVPVLVAAMLEMRATTCNSAVMTVLLAFALDTDCEHAIRGYGLAENQAMASPSGSERLVFTLPPTKCTDGVDRRCEATPAPDSLGWSATPPYGQPVSLYGDQYAFGLHGNR
jgi:hypothetical protein